MDTQFFQQLFEQHPAIMLIVEPGTGRIISSNQAASDFYGYSRAELQQINAGQINPLSPSETNQIRQARIRGEQTRFIVPNRLASGEIRIVEVEVSPITWENKTVLFAIIRDITKYKRLEELLHQKESRDLIQKLFAAIPTPVFYKDTQGKYLACNQAFAEMLGQSLTEIIGLTAFDLFPKAVAQHYHEKDLAILSEPPHHQAYEDKMYNHILQEERTFLTTKSVIRDGEGQIMGLVGVMIDITERVKMEEALRKSDERWQYALEGSGDGVWDWNVQTHEVFYSERWKEMLGYTADEIKPDLSEWERLVHPEDKELVYEKLGAHLRGETPAQSCEARMLHKDGTYRWILTRGKVMSWTAEGKPLRMVGTHKDITERKHLQIELEAAKDKMEQLAIYDPLTGAHNRLLLTEKLTQAISQRQHHLVAILQVDLDEFKKINDIYGHQDGDSLLIEVVKRMKTLLRENDTLIRMGGDEFLLIAQGVESLAQAEGIAARLLQVMQQPIQLVSAEVSPTSSVGIALCPDHGLTPEDLLVNSDRALYHAKSQGKNCYAFTHDISNHQTMSRL